MAMPEAARIWTREEVLALPDDGNRYELRRDVLDRGSRRQCHRGLEARCGVTRDRGHGSRVADGPHRSPLEIDLERFFRPEWRNRGDR